MSIQDRHNTVRTRVLTLGVAMLLAAGGASGQEASAPAGPKLAPSELLILVNDTLDRYPERQQRATVRAYMERLGPVGDSDMERLALADLSFLAIDPAGARAGFEPFLERRDMVGRAAWWRILQVRFAGLQMYEEVEEQVYSYRQNYPPIPADRSHLSVAVGNLANRYFENGDAAAGIRMVVDEIESLPFDAPYRSFLLPSRFYAGFDGAGQGPRACTMLSDAHAGLSAELRRRRADPATAENGAGAAALPFSIRFTDLGENPTPGERNAQFQSLLWDLEEALAQHGCR